MSDPQFGDNPVCLLANYATYALVHLQVRFSAFVSCPFIQWSLFASQHLEMLDAKRLDAETVQQAEATFLKKQVC